MCGVPYHSCEGYIARLIAKGYKVAICEQTEDPALAKGLVDRDIIRVVTPGTVISSSMLEDSKNNYLCAVYADSARYGLCLCDLSTGEVYATAFPAGRENLDHLKNELARFHPAEALLSAGAWEVDGLRDFLKERLDCPCENGGEGRFRPDVARALETGQLGGLGVDVAATEPIPPDSPLLRAPNCIITPHVAWVPKETRQRLLDFAVENLRCYLAGRPINVIGGPGKL